MDKLTSMEPMAATEEPARPRRRRGFTLIEVMVSMLILAFGLLAVASAQVVALRGGQNGRHLSRAVQLAQEHMELVQRNTWLSPELAVQNWSPIPTNPVRTTQVQAPVNQNEMTYTLQQRVTNVIPNNLREIDIRVTWNEPNRGNRTYTLTGIRYNYEGL